MYHRVAIAHASGVAGEAILEKLSESGISPDALVLLDEEKNGGTRLGFANRYLEVYAWREFDFSEISLLLLLEANVELERVARSCGCLVVSHLVESDQLPLFIAAGEQPDLAYDVGSLRLAGPELACLLPPLRTLDRHYSLEHIHLTLLRSAEFYGKAGVEELAAQTISLLNTRESETRVLPTQLAFNLIPEAGDRRLARELDRILNKNPNSISVQSIMVPVFHGFAAAIQLTCNVEIDLDEARRQLLALDKLRVRDDSVNPIADCNQSFYGIIGYLEQLPTQPSSLQCWLIADPMRYGLANNYVNVTDFLLKSFL